MTAPSVQQRPGAVAAALPPRRLAVAPMMDWTDRHCRFFLRLISRRTWLYTEMVSAAAVLHGDRERLLAFDPFEHPLALQLGGSEPQQLAEAARIGADFGYDEINLNVGCPSDRVRSGRFGACLMLEPERVARCVTVMARAVAVPVTVKTRIGVDEHDSYAQLHGFVATLADAGCRTLIVHARKAWLQGLSPKENRDVPPLRYDVVYRLKEDFPELEIVVNGGVRSLDEVSRHLEHTDGVMVGREAYHNPYILAGADRRIFADSAAMRSREDVVAELLPYLNEQLARGVALQHITRHILGLFQGLPGARAWRRHLSERAHRAGADAAVVREALGQMRKVAG